MKGDKKKTETEESQEEPDSENESPAGHVEMIEHWVNQFEPDAK